MQSRHALDELPSDYPLPSLKPATNAARMACRHWDAAVGIYGAEVHIVLNRQHVSYLSLHPFLPLPTCPLAWAVEWDGITDTSFS